MDLLQQEKRKLAKARMMTDVRLVTQRDLMKARLAAKAAQRQVQQALRIAQAGKYSRALRGTRRGKMSFLLERAATGKTETIDFATFSALATAAITRLSKRRDGLAIELSNNLVLDINPGPSKLTLEFIPQQAAASASARIWLIRKSGERRSAALIEERLWHMRQLYALLCLLLDGTIAQAAEVLGDRNADLEPYIPQEYRLEINGLGPGSVWLDVVFGAVKKGYEKVKKAPDAALRAVSLISSKGREKFWRRLEADTKTREAKASQEEAHAKKAGAAARQAEAVADRAEEVAAQERVKTAKSRVQAIKAITDTVDKIKDPEIKRLTQERLKSELTGLTGAKDGKLLPPPS